MRSFRRQPDHRPTRPQAPHPDNPALVKPAFDMGGGELLVNKASLVRKLLLAIVERGRWPDWRVFGSWRRIAYAALLSARVPLAACSWVNQRSTWSGPKR